MFNNKSFLKYAFPLFVCSPMVNLGSFGFTISELLTLFFGTLIFFFSKEKFRIPTILLVFILFVFAGRVGAFVNTFKYDIPFNYTKFIFFFSLFILLVSYQIGRKSHMFISEIMAGKFTKVILMVTLVIAILYVVSGYDTRARLLYLFTQKGADVTRFTAPRFPGLGVNGNIYSYIVLIFMIFSVKNYFEERVNIFIPLSCMFVIILITSKTSIASSLIVLLSFAFFYYFKKQGDVIKARRKSRIVFTSLIILGVLVFFAGIYFSEYFVILDRFDELLGNSEQNNSINTRGILMSLGMERVRLEPIFGIDVVQADMISDTVPLYFVTPHNEFIFYWMSLGLLGLLGYIILMIYLIWVNVYKKFRLEWVLLYVTLIAQMFVDGAFQTLRFQFMFFILVGLNYKELQYKFNKIEIN